MNELKLSNTWNSVWSMMSVCARGVGATPPVCGTPLAAAELVALLLVVEVVPLAEALLDSVVLAVALLLADSVVLEALLVVAAADAALLVAADVVAAVVLGALVVVAAALVVGAALLLAALDVAAAVPLLAVVPLDEPQAARSDMAARPLAPASMPWTTWRRRTRPEALGWEGSDIRRKPPSDVPSLGARGVIGRGRPMTTMSLDSRPVKGTAMAATPFPRCSL